MKPITRLLLFMLTVVLLVQCEKDEEISLPSVITGDITNVTPNSAVCCGEVTSDGGAVLRGGGIVWSTFMNPDYDDNKIIVSPSGIENFTTRLTGLRPNVRYYIKAFATNRKGRAFGEEKVFITPALNTGTFTDNRDGRTYKWVEIGDQVWMAENLAYLPFVYPPENQGGIWVYNYPGYSVSEAKITDEYKTYGCLYDYESACDGCPDGWHLPTDEEWKEMEMYLGMSREDADGTFYRGTKEGSYLKEIGNAHWIFCTNCSGNCTVSGTNITGFTALPGGVRSYYLYGECYGLGEFATFWSSTEVKSEYDCAWQRELNGFHEDIRRSCLSIYCGRSVRCVKD